MTETFRERCSRIDGVIAEKYYAVALAAQQLAMAEHGLAFGKRVGAVSGHRTYGAKGYPVSKRPSRSSMSTPIGSPPTTPAASSRSRSIGCPRPMPGCATARPSTPRPPASTRAGPEPSSCGMATGHIHSSMACSTCYPTRAEFGWLTDLSGADEAEIIEHAKEVACTVCYPRRSRREVQGRGRPPPPRQPPGAPGPAAPTGTVRASPPGAPATPPARSARPRRPSPVAARSGPTSPRDRAPCLVPSPPGCSGREGALQAAWPTPEETPPNGHRHRQDRSPRDDHLRGGTHGSRRLRGAVVHRNPPQPPRPPS